MAVTDILKNVSLATEQVTVLYPYLREVFINETPLITRTPRQSAEGASYSIITYNVRQRPHTLNAAINNTGTTLTLTDTTDLMIGDVLELQNSAGSATERVYVSAVPTNTTVTITRAAEGTSAVANDTNTNTSLTVTLIGNSRFGSEVDQVATRSARVAIPQYTQTFLYPVQIGGLANAVRNTRLPAGISDVFSLEQKTKMTEMMRDAEYTSYYGKGEAPTSAITGKQKGLKTLIGYWNGTGAMAAGSNVNVKTSAGGSYTMLNFVADGIQKALDGGGDPDTVICSTSFMTGLATWGFAKQQVIQPRQNELGTPIKEIEVPFTTGPVTFIPSYQLAAGTAIVLTSKDVTMRYIRPEFWQPRGIRGDAREGDFIGDLCVEVGHPGWHAWVEGVTGFA